MSFAFDTTYLQLPERFYERARATPASTPKLIALADDELITTLGLTRAWLQSDEALGVLSGNTLTPGSESIALAYAGHQFGNFVPQLGDGRALLLGEVVGTDGKRRDVQLKGSGRTRFSRGGDGRAAIGPVLRELVVSEAMHSLGVPTTRVLAAVTTGDLVHRERALPGAVLTRIAASHLRIGTFEYFAARKDRDGVQALIDYALTRHYPEVAREDGSALALFDAVAAAQMRLVSQWLALGFIHGVMNTDNMALSGETIDYGPCAFLDTYSPNRVFSSIDEQGRYAFANQPNIMLWNLARFAETLLPFVSDGGASAVAVFTERIERLPAAFDALYGAALCKKIGSASSTPEAIEHAFALHEIMAKERMDYTLTFRRLARGEIPVELEAWSVRWSALVGDRDAALSLMRSVNPAFIPRNHRVEEMIDAATKSDFAPMERLRAVLTRPYDDQPEYSDLEAPPGDEQWGYRTFCGT